MAELSNIYDDINDDDQAPSQAKTWLVRVGVALLVLLVLAAIGFGILKLMSGGAPHKKQVTTIKLLPDTPPPPPPPPPKEPPKEQPKEQPKEIKVEQPKPAETPPAEQLKMEGAAGDGPSPFAAGTVNNEYKGGEVKTIGSDGGAKFNWYAGVVKSQIEDALERDKELSVAQYKLVVTVWLNQSGKIDKLEFANVDASDEILKKIRSVLEGMSAMRDSPPQDMPQPIKLRVAAKKMN